MDKKTGMETIRKIFNFYIEGFSSMHVGKRLWIVITIKLFIIFAVLKVFFFPNFLQERFDTQEKRSNHVLENLTRGGK